MHSDPIADFVIRIKNGYMARKSEVAAPTSKVKEEIAKILLRKNFITDYVKDDKQITVTLRYEDKTPALRGVKRISKPGLRVYVNTKKVPRVLGGYGIAIISTPQGLMTDGEARAQNIGGEVMLKIW